MLGSQMVTHLMGEMTQMLVDKMVKAWQGRPDDVPTGERAEGPRVPAGASPLDEMYLDAAAVGGVMMQPGVDGPTLGCTFPTSGSPCGTSGCTVV
jgi:hypothetical protein